MDICDTDLDLVSLLKRVAQGDQLAYRQLHGRTRAALFRQAFQATWHRETAEDVLQEAFITIWRAAGSYQAERGAPYAWMVAIVKSRARDNFRRTQVRGGLVTYPLDGQSYERACPRPKPEDMLAIRQRSQQLTRCLERLPAVQRSALIGAYFQDVSHTEAAAQSGIPLGTVKSNIRRGVASLRKIIGVV